jgi:hypothetical protein
LVWVSQLCNLGPQLLPLENGHLPSCEISHASGWPQSFGNGCR